MEAIRVRGMAKTTHNNVASSESLLLSSILNKFQKTTHLCYCILNTLFIVYMYPHFLSQFQWKTECSHSIWKDLGNEQKCMFQDGLMACNLQWIFCEESELIKSFFYCFSLMWSLTSCKQRPSQHLVKVITSDSFARRLGPHCARLLLCFVNPEEMVKGASDDDPLFTLFCPPNSDHEC